MKLSEKMSITKRTADGAFYGEKNGTSYVIEHTHPEYTEYESLYNLMRETKYADRTQVFEELVNNNRYPNIFNTISSAAPAPQPKKSPVEILTNGLKHMMSFFTEFSFTPSLRFVNTFAYMACKDRKSACDYVYNYFALMDSSYTNEIRQKMQSAEFNQIIDDIAQYGVPKEHINTRLKIYYGSAGTGKTTLAQEEADNRCIVCNSSMLPSDLMEDFIFKDGQPDFNPSLLWECMEEGRKVVLDEINLLPFDSLRFLQGIVDGKTEFYYKNRPVHIAEGFQIIGTMNLSLGGMTYGLPEPLVDRCAETREFVLTADQLAKAIMGME
jgi:hypothetical protein